MSTDELHYVSLENNVQNYPVRLPETKTKFVAMLSCKRFSKANSMARFFKEEIIVLCLTVIESNQAYCVSSGITFGFRQQKIWYHLVAV